MTLNNRLPRCPRCQGAGHRVKPKTLDELLVPAARKQIKDIEGWSFCDSPTCEVVYFHKGHEEHQNELDQDALTVPVGVKRNSAPRPLCYCFDHSVESLQIEPHPEHALDQIKALMKSDGCRCVSTNPQGRCCLSTVEAAIKVIQAGVRS